jgi:hypothetical protein
MACIVVTGIPDVLTFIVPDLVWIEDDEVAFLVTKLLAFEDELAFIVTALSLLCNVVFEEATEHRGTGTATGIFSADVKFSFCLLEYDDDDDEDDDDDDADVEDKDVLRLEAKEDNDDDTVDLL